MCDGYVALELTAHAIVKRALKEFEAASGEPGPIEVAQSADPLKPAGVPIKKPPAD